MKKILFILFAVVMLLSIFMFSGCGAKAAIEDSKIILDEYYKDYSDEDASDMMSIMHEDLLKELGSEDEVETRLLARRALLGDIEDYDFGNIAFETNNGVTNVNLTVNANYKTGYTTEEEFSFTSIDGELLMTGISLPKESIVDEMTEDFLSALDEPDKMADMYIPLLQGSDLENALSNISQNLFNAGGKYLGYDLTGQEYHYINLADTAAVYVYSGSYNLEFSNIEAICELQISVEDGTLGINNFKVSPRIVVNLCEDYYSAISQKSIEKAANLYSTYFYDATTGGRDAWITGVLAPLANDYGKFINYTINDWSYQQTMLPDGISADTISILVYSDFENIKLKELIVVGYDGDGNYQILSHQIEVNN